MHQGIYIAVQLLASFAAALMSWALLDNTFHPGPGKKDLARMVFQRPMLIVAFLCYVVTTGVGVSEARATAAEAIWTFLLATVVLQCATTATQAGNSFFGLAIGFTVLAGAIGVGREFPMPPHIRTVC